MKKLLLFAAIAMAGCAIAVAQSYNMYVHLNNGNVATYEADSVSHVTFEEESLLPADAGFLNVKVQDDGSIILSIDPIARATSYKWLKNGVEVRNDGCLSYITTEEAEFQVAGVNEYGEGAPSPAVRVKPIEEEFNIMDETHLPNEIIREYVLNNIAHGSTYYTNIQAAQYTGGFDFTNNTNLTNIQGLEYFTSMQELILSGTGVGKLDLTPFTCLRKLDCMDAINLESLNIDGLNELTYFEIGRTKLYKYDLSTLNRNLTHLGGMWLEYTDDDLTVLSEFTNLEYLDMSCVKITTLDCSMMPKLKTLQCWGNGSLTSLNIDNCYVLDYLLLTSDKKLTEVSTKGCVSLREVYLNYTGLTKFDLSRVKSTIEVFNCIDSKMEEFDPKGMINLRMCQIQRTPIAGELDFSDCILLTNLRVHEMENVTALNVSNLRNLEELHVFNTSIETITVTDAPNLTYLNLFNNKLTDITVSNLPSLKMIGVYGNQLKRIDISTLRQKASFYLFENDPDLQIRVWSNFDMDNPPSNINKDDSAQFVYEFED